MCGISSLVGRTSTRVGIDRAGERFLGLGSGNLPESTSMSRISGVLGVGLEALLLARKGFWVFTGERAQAQAQAPRASKPTGLFTSITTPSCQKIRFFFRSAHNLIVNL